MRIYIVRHGETKANEEGRLQGWSNDELNAFGVELAELTGKALTGIHFDAAYSSPLIRAKSTAEIILKESGNDCDIITDDRLKEIYLGSFEGKKFRPGECEVDRNLMKNFFEDPLNAECFPGGECTKDVMVRAVEFFNELVSKDYENVLVTTHGCTLRSMLNSLYDDPSDFWHGHVPYNCCVNVVNAENGSMTLEQDDVILYDKKLCKDRFNKY